MNDPPDTVEDTVVVFGACPAFFVDVRELRFLGDLFVAVFVCGVVPRGIIIRPV